MEQEFHAHGPVLTLTYRIPSVRGQHFADGFESGNTSAWSRTVP